MMGYWTQDKQGRSFAEGNGLWGDAPADLFDDTLDQIVKTFQRDVGRLPSLSEIRAGLEFSLTKYKYDDEWTREGDIVLSENPPPADQDPELSLGQPVREEES